MSDNYRNQLAYMCGWIEGMVMDGRLDRRTLELLSVGCEKAMNQLPVEHSPLNSLLDRIRVALEPQTAAV